jgi:mannose/fructose/N-acetylgalactosamine-specific phosphotransferase system component IID
MSAIIKWIILLVLISIAISFYSYGNSTGMFIFIVLGVLFEAAFWLKLSNRKKKQIVVKSL